MTRTDFRHADRSDYTNLPPAAWDEAVHRILLAFEKAYDRIDDAQQQITAEKRAGWSKEHQERCRIVRPRQTRAELVEEARANARKRQDSIKAYLLNHPNMPVTQVAELLCVNDHHVYEAKRDLGLKPRNSTLEKLREMLAQDPELSHAEVAERLNLKIRYAKYLLGLARGAVKPRNRRSRAKSTLDS